MQPVYVWYENKSEKFEWIKLRNKMKTCTFLETAKLLDCDIYLYATIILKLKEETERTIINIILQVHCFAQNM